MKKLLIIILPVSLLALITVFIFFPKKSTTSVNGKFGFLRDAFNMEQERIEDTGATWFRPNFGYFVWGAMQKDAYAPVDFSKTDELVSQSQKHGLNLVITLFPFADWDQKINGDKCKVADDDNMLPQKKGGFETPGLPYYRCNPNDWVAYEKWLTAVVKRYPTALYYEIGNEPDSTTFYIGSPEQYAELLQKSYTTIKATTSNAKILIAAPSGVQPQFIKFWEKVFATPKIADYFDIGNMHCLSAPNQDENDPTSSSANDLNVTVYKNLLTSYKITKPIWVTEAENVQGSNVAENVKRLDDSVTNALKNGAEKIFFTGNSFSGDPMRYTSEILISEKSYYKSIISKAT